MATLRALVYMNASAKPNSTRAAVARWKNKGSIPSWMKPYAIREEPMIFMINDKAEFLLSKTCPLLP